MTVTVTVNNLETNTTFTPGTIKLDNLNITNGTLGGSGFKYSDLIGFSPEEYGQIMNGGGTLAALINGKLYVIDPADGTILGEANPAYNCSYDPGTSKIIFENGTAYINNHPVSYMGIDSSGTPIEINYQSPAYVPGSLTTDVDGNCQVQIDNADNASLNGIPLTKDADGKFIIPAEYVESWLLNNWQITAVFHGANFDCEKTFNPSDFGITAQFAVKGLDVKVEFVGNDPDSLLSSSFAGSALTRKSQDYDRATTTLEDGSGNVLAVITAHTEWINDDEGYCILTPDGRIWGKGHIRNVTTWLDEEGQQSSTNAIFLPYLPEEHDYALSVRANLDSPKIQTLPPGILSRENLQESGQDFFNAIRQFTGDNNLLVDFVLPSGTAQRKILRFNDKSVQTAVDIIASANGANIFGEEDLPVLLILIDLLENKNYKNGLVNVDKSLLTAFIQSNYQIIVPDLAHMTSLYGLATGIAAALDEARAGKELPAGKAQSLTTPNVTNNGKGGFEGEVFASFSYQGLDNNLGKATPEIGLNASYSWGDIFTLRGQTSLGIPAITGADVSFSDASAELLKLRLEAIWNISALKALYAAFDYKHQFYNSDNLPWMNIWRAALGYRQYFLTSGNLLPYFDIAASIESIAFDPNHYDSNGPGGIQTLTFNPLFEFGLTNAAKTWSIAAQAAPRFNLSRHLDNDRSIYRVPVEGEPLLDLPQFSFEAAHNNLLAFLDTGRFSLPGSLEFSKIATTGKLDAKLGLAAESLFPGLDLVQFNFTTGLEDLYRKNDTSIMPNYGAELIMRLNNGWHGTYGFSINGDGKQTHNILFGYSF
jgi:hypothetical protein